MTEEKSYKKLKIITIILSVFLLISISYIILDKYFQVQQREQFIAYQQGYNEGYAQAIIQIVQQASTCQQVPLIVGNSTMNIIAVNCLK
ncbi:MAG: hypothetical protein QXF15_00500 [Candidatus Aenigmatarchaeota archaeon]|nr:hypothetical protein [Candidatus Aenigmarchaeota archaeon]